MQEDMVRKIRSNPRYEELVKTRKGYGWLLTAVMMVVYYGYILLIAFDKEFLAKPVGDGVMTYGVPIGFGVIVFTIVITGIYVRRANSEFDAMSTEIVREVNK